MRTPLFSIVIPTYNRAELLPSAVQSVLDQTIGDFEIVVSDNHSTDHTRAEVARFADSRIRYVQPARHLRHLDHFEFLWRQAHGKLILLLGDDDALVSTALEQFADASARFGADFLFSNVAEYRFPDFQGELPNSVDCPAFTGVTRVVQKDEYLRPAFAFRPAFVFHPTAYVFAKTLAERVAGHGGMFFRTSGIETYSWTMAAALATRMVYIDAPLGIMGRTQKSFGSNVALSNPGRKKIQEAKADYGTTFEFSPLRTMAFPNIMADGILGAKIAHPELFADYEFDFPNYLRATMHHIRVRKSMGVDVEADIAEVLAYAARYPGLARELATELPVEQATLLRRARRWIGDLGARKVSGRMRAVQQLQILRRGRSEARDTLLGEFHGFQNILECAHFLTPFVSPQAGRVQRAG